jgi:hypothetical protein
VAVVLSVAIAVAFYAACLVVAPYVKRAQWVARASPRAYHRPDRYSSSHERITPAGPRSVRTSWVRPRSSPSCGRIVVLGSDPHLAADLVVQLAEALGLQPATKSAVAPDQTS